MPAAMTSEERELRFRLDEAVRRIRSTLKRCPWVDELDHVTDADVDLAAALVAEANGSLQGLESCTDALAQLRGASEEAIALIVTSRHAAGVVREVLTVLSAAIDCRRAA